MDPVFERKQEVDVCSDHGAADASDRFEGSSSKFFNRQIIVRKSSSSPRRPISVLSFNHHQEFAKSNDNRENRTETIAAPKKKTDRRFQKRFANVIFNHKPNNINENQNPDH